MNDTTFSKIDSGVYYAVAFKAYFFSGKMTADTITFADSFKADGFYLFCDEDYGTNIPLDIKREAKAYFSRSGYPHGIIYYGNGIRGIFIDASYEIKHQAGFGFPPYLFYFSGKITAAPDKIAFKADSCKFYCEDKNVVSTGSADINSDGIAFFAAFSGVFSDLGAGMYYTAEGEERRLGFLRTFYSDVFNDNFSGNLHFHICPQSVLDAAKSYIEVLPANAVFTSASRFVSPGGRSITLSNTAGDMRLCFEKKLSCRCLEELSEKPFTYYLGFSGSFTIPENEDFLCGNFAAEFVKVKSGFNVKFIPGYHANLENTPAGAEAKWDKATTAAYIDFGGSEYYCQSRETPFFTPQTSETGILDFCPLKLSDIAENRAVPIIPMQKLTETGGIKPKTDDPDDILKAQKTEEAFLKSFAEAVYFRRNSIFTNVPALQNVKKNEADTLAVNSNGAVVTVSGSGITEMIIAARTDKTPIKLINIDDSLRKEIQAINPKIIFKKPGSDYSRYFDTAPGSYLLKYGDCGEWQFDFAPDKWRDDTVIFIKYGNDVSVAEFLKDDDVFNTAMSKCYDENNNLLPQYENFMKTVNNADFTGILILNCPFSFDDTVCKNANIVRVIDSYSGDKYAHSVIISASKLEFEGGIPTIEKSSVDIAVDLFTDSQAQLSYTGTAAPDISFVTTGIKLIINDGEIVSLETRSELTLNRIFSAYVSKNGSGGQSMLIDGKLQNNNNSFVFSLREAVTYAFSASVLTYMRFTAITMPSADFYLSGELAFEDYSADGGFDIFGYGDVSGGGSGSFPLIFSQMKFKYAEADNSYTALYSEISLKGSEPRADSFPKLFPARPDSLYCENNKKPLDRGLIPVLTDSVRQAAADDFVLPWYGLRFPIVFGDFGDIADSLGLAASLHLCFSGNNFFAGLKPPDGFFGGGLSSSALMNFSAKTISLKKQDGTFIFTFNGLAVKILKQTFPSDQSVGLQITSNESGKPGWSLSYDDEKG
ncbi:MAG: hypothetical protein LBM87_00265 [Ruminococcus sp.]|jgi:hypothetical protein|nr:hypothetical protein [Ruminococcus sp.]